MSGEHALAEMFVGSAALSSDLDATIEGHFRLFGKFVVHQRVREIRALVDSDPPTLHRSPMSFGTTALGASLDVARSPRERGLSIAVRVLWFLVLPCCVAFSLYRFALPTPVDEPASSVERLVRLLHDQPLVTVLASSCGMSAWARLLRHHLPLARFAVDYGPAPRGLSALELLRFERAEHAARGSASRLRAAVSFFSSLVVAVLAALLVRSSLASVAFIPSGSMVPTLREGDYVLVDARAYGLRLFGRRYFARAPERGDVVVFRNAQGDRLIKRVIGVAGDVVSMDRGHPVLDGRALSSCDLGSFAFADGPDFFYARLFAERLGDATYLATYTPMYRPFEGVYRVRKGEVFVVGDNRNESNDSRALNGGHGGGVPLDAIEGRATHVLFSLRPDRSWDLQRALLTLSSPTLEPEGESDAQERLSACLTGGF